MMMAPSTGPWSLLGPEEARLCQSFMDEGHVIIPAEDPDALNAIQQKAAELAAEHLALPAPGDPKAFLDDIHARVDAQRLNALRLRVIQGLNGDSAFRQRYFRLAAQALGVIVGNELAMQRRINLSIQLPGDTSSLLPIHADVWSGDSPFEVVVWVPLVDCISTKSMYLLSPAADSLIQGRLAEFAEGEPEDLFKAVADKIRFLEVPFGSVLLFSPNLMHGNQTNCETTTRWSMNCRFKSILAPYGDKKLGEFFDPLVIRPATRMGLSYRLPRGFDA